MDYVGNNMNRKEIPWLLIASIVIVIAVQYFLPSDPDPLQGIVENKTVAGINDGNKEVVVAFTIYGTNSSIENWEELFGNDTSISNDSEILLMESYDEIQYKMVVGYKEDMKEYIVSKEDFNRVKLYEIIRYVPDGDHVSIREVVHSPD